MPELSPEITIPSGLRRFTLTMLSVRDQADEFKGVPRGSGKPFRFWGLGSNGTENQHRPILAKGLAVDRARRCFKWVERPVLRLR